MLLATDGVERGITDEGALVRLIQEQKQGGIFLSVLGWPGQPEGQQDGGHLQLR